VRDAALSGGLAAEIERWREFAVDTRADACQKTIAGGPLSLLKLGLPVSENAADRRIFGFGQGASRYMGKKTRAARPPALQVQADRAAEESGFCRWALSVLTLDRIIEFTGDRRHEMLCLDILPERL
jgi:hypothetical protein